MFGTKLENIHRNTKIPQESKFTMSNTQSKMIRHAKENTTFIGEKFNPSKATRIDRDDRIAGQEFYKTGITIIFYVFKS